MLLKILGVLLFSLLVSIYFFQAKLLFYPTKLEQDFSFKFSRPFEEKFIFYNNKVIHGLLFKSIDSKARIIYFHGNGGALDLWGHVGATMSEKLQSDILILDFPGYGKSTGGLPSSEQELLESAEAAFDYFISTTDAKLPIIVYGRSLGSAVASFLALKKTTHALIRNTVYEHETYGRSGVSIDAVIFSQI